MLNLLFNGLEGYLDLIRKKDLIKLKLLLLSLHKQEEKKVISNVKGEFRKTVGFFTQKYNLIGINFVKNKVGKLIASSDSQLEYVSLKKEPGKNNRMIRLSIVKHTTATLGYNSEINYRFDESKLEVIKINCYEKYSRLIKLVNYKVENKFNQIIYHDDEISYIRTLKEAYPYLYNWLIDIYPYIENNLEYEKIKNK